MKEFDAVADWDDEIEAFLTAWARRLTGLQNEVALRIYNYLDELDAEAPIGRNLLVLARLRTDLVAQLRQAGFEALADELVAMIRQTLIRLHEIFRQVLDLENEGETLVAELETAADGVREVFLTQGIGQAVVWPVVAAIQPLVIAKARPAQLRQAVLTSLKSRQGRSQMELYASDSIYQFSRSYTRQLARRAGIRHWYYMGTRMATSRDFCGERIGKVYTQQQVESWASLDWSGKHPNTTKETIFWYVGGYRCRHRLLPITEQQYKRFINQQTN